MATFTTKITPGKIEQELTFNGSVFRQVSKDTGGHHYIYDGLSIYQQAETFYPENLRLWHCLFTMGEDVGDDKRMDILADLQAIEDEYAKEKEELPCGK